MTGLRELQESFQRALIEGDDSILSEILDSSKEKRQVLLGVYQNAYVLRLRDILADDYEQVATMLGDSQFAVMADAYIEAHPSQSPTARWFGSKLPEFLAEQAGYRDQPVLAELASLERALNDAFDAADDAPLRLEDLAQVPPEHWGALSFTPHPAVRRTDFTTNADEVWGALKDGNNPPPVEALAEPRRIIVYRPDAMAKFRIMPPDEAMMWDEAAEGVTFGVLCEMLATYAGSDEVAAQAAVYLQRWIEAGMLRRDPYEQE